MITDKMRNDISDLYASINTFRINKNAKSVEDIQYSLNKLFFNAKCKQVIYTDNTDKMFFGIMVIPVIRAKDLIGILQSDDSYIISEYYVELDSKLFDSKLSVDEIMACIIQNVGDMVIDSSAMRRTKEELDKYLVATNQTFKLTESIHYLELLSMGIRDAMRKLTSVFYKTDNEIENDEFMSDLEMSKFCISAMYKLRSEGKVNTEIPENAVIVLAWVIRLYNDILKNRIAAIHTLKKGIKFSPSVYERREYTNVIRRLERIDDDALLESAAQSIKDSIKRNAHTYKKNGIKDYEDDFYEINFQANNMETQDDALFLIHQINSRMSIIEDYLDTEDGVTKQERKRWMKLLDNYSKLREEIAGSKIYQNKTRLYVNYGYDD